MREATLAAGWERTSWPLSVATDCAGKRLDADIAFDLGANHGFFTMLLARNCRVVVAVEAFAPNVAVLERHLRINGIRNCRILHAAAGRENGLSFFAQGPNHATGKVCAEEGLEVNVVSLEELVWMFGPDSVFIMDEEGAEFEVLEGGADYTPGNAGEAALSPPTRTTFAKIAQGFSAHALISLSRLTDMTWLRPEGLRIEENGRIEPQRLVSGSRITEMVNNESRKQGGQQMTAQPAYTRHRLRRWTRRRYPRSRGEVL